jgi:hypothetical protein
LKKQFGHRVSFSIYVASRLTSTIEYMVNSGINHQFLPIFDWSCGISKALWFTQAMEPSVPSSIDVPRNSVSEYDVPMAFRRERYWFLSFVMTPFKDIEPRTVDNPSPRRRAGRGR